MPTFRSFAKLNLHLEVAGRRSDGYHELRTIFQTIDLADELEIEPRRRAGVGLEVDGAPDVPRDERNLAARAAALFLERWGRSGEGVDLRLRKRVPAGGGLGGGSANAGTVLLAMAALWRRAGDEAGLRELATGLGADVPFFLTGGSAFGAGRGDRILPLADVEEPAPEIWLALPPWSIATAAVFAALDPRRSAPPDPRMTGLERGEAPPRLVDRIGRNDLEAPAFRLRPELEAMYNSLVRAGARAVRMSGSGSTLFATFSDPGAARAAGVGLPSGTGWVRTRVLGRRAWRLQSGLDAIQGGQ
jgi:4-diphosphocytidyl-2-C-methyl-D-erythritol kinase